MVDEYNSIIANNTWDLVLPSTNANVIGCRWVHKVKQISDGSLDRYKARQVTQGYNKKHGLDYDQTFSPVVNPVTIQTIFTLAASKGENLVDERKEQSASRRTISRCSAISPKVTELENAEGQSKKAMELTKGRIAKWIGDPDC
ncbi:hypothetical protein MTR67_034066 [Solanum verrucosum]|uniref:Reverse transcriptase Ty1/copia-type domain-containing protein n=1 Tax=Solanum verrucosum TaxID=315347 RepID=A0AAF0ZI81_SOLVR|nr:hypothetical protein MTR67_034066 [Solanum verrucosum]